MEKKFPAYSPKEELVNTITHAFGLLLSIPGWVLLIIYSSLHGTVWHIVSFSIYGTTLVLLYLASTLYHGTKNITAKKKLNVLDHSAIYLLIAGTYTPFLLIVLRGVWGWSLFGIVWGLAILGIAIKILVAGRLKIVSATAYVLMGWIVVIALKPLINNLEITGLYWLFAGGLSYTIGAIFYVMKKIPYHHGIFHVFVLGGSFAHWWAVFFYLL